MGISSSSLSLSTIPWLRESRVADEEKASLDETGDALLADFKAGRTVPPPVSLPAGGILLRTLICPPPSGSPSTARASTAYMRAAIASRSQLPAFARGERQFARPPPRAGDSILLSVRDAEAIFRQISTASASVGGAVDEAVVLPENTFFLWTVCAAPSETGDFVLPGGKSFLVNGVCDDASGSSQAATALLHILSERIAIAPAGKLATVQLLVFPLTGAELFLPKMRTAHNGLCSLGLGGMFRAAELFRTDRLNQAWYRATTMPVGRLATRNAIPPPLVAPVVRTMATAAGAAAPRAGAAAQPAAANPMASWPAAPPALPSHGPAAPWARAPDAAAHPPSPPSLPAAPTAPPARAARLAPPGARSRPPLPVDHFPPRLTQPTRTGRRILPPSRQCPAAPPQLLYMHRSRTRTTVPEPRSRRARSHRRQTIRWRPRRPPRACSTNCLPPRPPRRPASRRLRTRRCRWRQTWSRRRLRRGMGAKRLRLRR